MIGLRKGDPVCLAPGECSLPQGILVVLHSVEPAGCSSLDVRDLVVKNLQTSQNKSISESLQSHVVCVCVCVSPCSTVCTAESTFSTYGAELLALVSHLLPYRPALGSQEVPEVDGMDGRAGLLVQRGVLADPVEDLPVQGAVVVQVGLRNR